MKKDKRDQSGFSRRDFIKTTATGLRFETPGAIDSHMQVRSILDGLGRLAVRSASTLDALESGGDATSPDGVYREPPRTQPAGALRGNEIVSAFVAKETRRTWAIVLVVTFIGMMIAVGIGLGVK